MNTDGIETLEQAEEHYTRLAGEYLRRWHIDRFGELPQKGECYQDEPSREEVDGWWREQHVVGSLDGSAPPIISEGWGVYEENTFVLAWTATRALIVGEVLDADPLEPYIEPLCAECGSILTGQLSFHREQLGGFCVECASLVASLQQAWDKFDEIEQEIARLRLLRIGRQQMRKEQLAGTCRAEDTSATSRSPNETRGAEQ